MGQTRNAALEKLKEALARVPGISVSVRTARQKKEFLASELPAAIIIRPIGTFAPSVARHFEHKITPTIVVVTLDHTPEQTEELMFAMVTEIMRDVTLGGTANTVKPVSADVLDFEPQDQGFTMVVEIMLARFGPFP